MIDPRMELPPPEELGAWLKETRDEYGVTQTELAERADLSPSQISRIEGRQGGTAYETLWRIQTALRSIIESRGIGGTRTAEEVLQDKHESYGEEFRFATVQPDSPVQRAVELMNELQVSQLPILAEDGDSVGRITEEDLLDVDDDQDRIRRHMGPPFPELGADTPAAIVRELLRTNEAVLVTAGKTELSTIEEHGYVGILTRADFAGNP